MRLTLRTLLAYLDDTLEAADAREIGQKLAETPMAQELVTRIREVTRRRRLTSPPLASDDIDPNQMAEYLDNLLSPEGIAEVERVCLESDIHLAEAAACHQILTMVGQPAQVSEVTRGRMYDLVHALESLPSERRPAARPPAEPAPVPSMFSHRPVLARVLTSAAVLVGAVVIGLLIRISLMNPGRTANPPDDKQVATGPLQPGEHFKSGDVPNGKDELPPLEKLDTPASKPATTKKPEPAEAPPVAETPTEKDGPPISAKPERPEPVEPAKPDTKPAEKPNEPEPTPKPAAPEPAVPLASYGSTSGILLHFDRSHNEYRRLPSRSVVNAEQWLICLPSYRAAIDFPSGVSVELVGLVREQSVAAAAKLDVTPAETEVMFLAAEAEGEVHVRLDRGRIVLGSNNASARFAIDFLDSAGRTQSWKLTLKGAETVAGFWLATPWKPGRACVTETVLYLPSGEAEFQSDERSDKLGGPVQLRWNAADGFSEPEGLPAPPTWIKRDEMSILMGKASTELAAERMMPPGASAVLPLVETVGSDRAQARVLAVQCLGAVGRLPNLIDALSVLERREVRQEAIRTLRQYMARGQVEEEALTQALAAKFGKSPEGQVRTEGVRDLLRGFSDAEAKNPETYDALIKLLGADELAIRELAISNLEELAGKLPNATYAPDKPNSNEGTINAWRRALKENRLPPKVRGKM